METNNPYQAPDADLTASQGDQVYDQTSVFSIKGRFGRLSYLAWYLLMSVVGWLILIVLAAIGLVSMDAMMAGALVASPLYWIVTLAMLVVGVIFGGRRLHDFNRSAWWLLLLIVPIVNFVFILAMIFWPGTQGANDFGPARFTPTWEKVVGWITPVLFVLMLFAIAIPAYNAYIEEARRAGLG